MVSPFGLPANYITNPMYLFYLQMMMQNAQMQMQLQRQQQESIYAQQIAAQQAQANAIAAQNAALQPQMEIQNSQYLQQPVQTVQSGDGKDDGKISFGKKIKNFGKGVINFFKGMVCDENGKFSLKRTFTTVAVAAGAIALSVVTGGAATPFIIAAGAAAGAVQTGKGIYKAATAKTDAEAELAWQQIGSGATALVGSIAGAKGALKGAGKLPTLKVSSSQTIPVSHQLTAGTVSNTAKMANMAKNAWNVTKDAFVSTGKCFKIAGKGSWDGMRGLAHPFKSGRQIGNYWKNTIKPNWENAFSYKNGYKNYTAANESRLIKNINDIDKKINVLINEKINNPSNAAKIQTKIDKLNVQKQINELELNISSNKLNKLSYKKFNKMVDEQLKNLQENAKILTGKDKAQAIEQIRNLEQFIARMNTQSKIGIAHENITRAQAEIASLKMKPATTIAEKEAIASRISKLENAIANDKKILRNANYKIAAQQNLPKVGLAYGTYYLAGRNPQAEISEADAYAQAYGFANAQQMQDYINVMQSSEAALNNADRVLAQTTAQQQYNPYASSIFQTYQMQPPVGNNLGFNELYVSPIPDLI